MAADRDVVIAVEDAVGAGTDLLGGRVSPNSSSAAAAFCAAATVRGRVVADLVEVLTTSSLTCSSTSSRISRTSSIGRPAGSGMSQASTIVGTYGQTSPQPIVIAQSACSCISTTALRLAPGQVDPDLAHHLDDLRPHALRRL